MNAAIIAAIISAAASIVVALISLSGVKSNNAKTATEIQHKLEIGQAVTDTKIEELTREVREHNNFAQRMPVVEDHLKTIDSQIKELKEYHKPK